MSSRIFRHAIIHENLPKVVSVADPLLSGQIVVVTGAAHGIGFAAATRLAAEGADLALLDLDAAALKQTAAQLHGKGNRVFVYAGDLTDRAVLAAGFARIAVEFGAVDVLVNNVGQGARGRATPFWESDATLDDFLLRVCLQTTLDCSRQVVPSMRDRRRGRIVNIASDSAFIGSKAAASYAAAKAGVIGFTRSLARELAPFQITVNAIAPGYIRTRAMDELPAAFIEKAISETPLGTWGEPEDVANAIAFFASDQSRYVTGQCLIVNGGRWMN